ncbi:MAG: UDP-N-acetylmuramoyl-tripeptide--D-alanyl-D-alanine ligase [Pseudomonadota bacterium]|nr:UDP-N-acetylmuramoyl-tripeptide--D-alanyl-D-alanine ligase [Pseudomonadota bacterium]
MSQLRSLVDQYLKAVDAIKKVSGHEHISVEIDSRLVKPHGIFCLIGTDDSESGEATKHGQKTMTTPKLTRCECQKRIKHAVEQGAALIVSDKTYVNDVPTLMVGNLMIKWLQAIACQYRNTWGQDKKVLAITGSVGKTSTKTLLAKLLSNYGVTHVSKDTQNGQLGVALTIINTPISSKFIVVEVGIDATGGMETLVPMVQPHIALITNIHESHLDGLGTRRGVAEEKSKLFRALQASGVAVLSIHSHEYHVLEAASLHCRRYRFAVNPGGAKGCVDAFMTVTGNQHQQQVYVSDHKGDTLTFEVQSKPESFFNNLLAAMCCIKVLGYAFHTMTQVAAIHVSVEGRMQHYRSSDQGWVIDDSYNAAPESVRHAIKYLGSQTDKKRILVFADMKELGDRSHYWHQQVGVWCQQERLDGVITTGQDSKAVSDFFRGVYKHIDTLQDLAQYVLDKQWLTEEYVILLKGSNSMKLSNLRQYWLCKPVSNSPTV